MDPEEVIWIGWLFAIVWWAIWRLEQRTERLEQRQRKDQP